MRLGIYPISLRDGKHYSLRNTNGSLKTWGGFQQSGFGDGVIDRARDTITTPPGKIKELTLAKLTRIS